MKAKPFPKNLYEKAVALNLTKITLAFSGGNDEGYLDVSCEPYTIYPAKPAAGVGELLDELLGEVQDWAWDVYSYNGAGDGSDYGDNIVYDLVNKKVTTNEWYMSKKEEPYEEDTFLLGSDTRRE